MATVTGLTAARMQEIVDATVVGAHIDGDDLILELYDASEINAGDVRGPTGPQGNAEVGDTKTSIRASNHSGWLIFGATHTGAATAYPALWALSELPAAWKVGSDLVLPSMADTVFEGDGAGTAVGDITGANTVVLDDSNLPPHFHTQPTHTHTWAAHTHPIGAHVHSIAHDHANFSTTTSTDGSHSHAFTQGSGLWAPSGGNTHNLADTGTGDSSVAGIQSAGAHDHSVSINIPLYSGNSGAPSADPTGSGGGGNTGASGGDNTGNGPGTSAAFSIEQKAMRMNYFIYGGL